MTQFKKEDTKIKKIIKQVQDTKIKKEVQEKVAEKNKPSIRYVGTITIKYRVLNKDNKEEPLTRTLIFDRVLKKSQLEEEINEMIFDDEMFVLNNISWVIAVLETNIKQTIKPVENTGRMENIRMRKAGAGLIDGYDKQDWDTNTGRCVFDYIISRYGNIKGIKNVCNYEDLNNIFDNSIWEDEKKDLFEIGVNTQEIQRFCERYKIPMYAIDDNEKLIDKKLVLESKVSSLKKELAVVTAQKDSLYDENFSRHVELGRYELSLDYLQSKDPNAALQFVNFMNHETE